MKTLKILFKLFLCFYPVLLLYGCEKSGGNVYLRVINMMPSNASMTVQDNEQVVPADGLYHQVYGFVETKSKLTDVVTDSITNWTSECYLPVVWKEDVLINAYSGEFEKRPGDSYYTLTVRYRVKYEQPLFQVFKPWLNIYLEYLDNNKLVYSPTE